MFLLVIGLLLLLSAFALVRVYQGKYQEQAQKERMRQRVGIGRNLSQTYEVKSTCAWCRVGRVLGSKNPKQLAILKSQLVSAGYSDESHIGAYYFFKFTAIALSFFIAFILWVFQDFTPLLMIIVPLIVMLIPERVLINLGEKRLEKINQQLPDFLDMTTICMNAGLSYLVSVKRVSEELRDVSPEICNEFQFMLEQIQVGVPRIEALHQFAQRNPTKDIQNLIQVLVQNEKLGSSISEALYNFSRTIYQDRENLMEEKAAKTSAKMAIIILPFMLLPYVMLLLGEKLVMLGRGL
ncbi:type II secretion system F family protein [Thiomicrorhabdus sp. 6S2-11]|uniref:Type II secretion system F family protein n=2 Tax=Thiomicrorhabdus marina TaxID=2818442 RepID=A0ABS3Q5S9_9GAMM|nr:type II secretion system F family protein [Thiomicrorhabdus marina]